MVDRKKLAVIHIAKQELGLGDDEYRQILWSCCRVRSACEIGTTREFVTVMKALERLGWKGASKRKSTQLNKCKKLWGLLYGAGKVRNGSEEACKSFVRKITPQMTPSGMSRAIEALKGWCDREGVL